MSIEVRMPRLSDTMEEGKILRWLKKPGERVAVGDVLAEVETDKADMELEAVDGGVLARVLIEEGGSATVGQAIAVLNDAAEAKAAQSDPAEPAPEQGAEGTRSQSANQPPPASPHSGESASKASPLARQIARERGVDLASIAGSGPGGRVVRRDLERARSAAAERVDAVEPSAPPSPAQPGRREALSRIRRTVARRMAESKRQTPHFYVTAEIEMGECSRLKDGLAAARPDGPAVTYTHLLLRAVTLAFAEHPRLNARYAAEDAIEYADGVHLGIATALEEGLIVPVLHDCGAKGVFEIALEARALVERVRAGKAQGADLSGGTFTLSNLGMFPVEEFAAVINPPQAAVLAVGAVRSRAVVKDGAVVAAMTMRVTLSCDHRVVDGAEAARFLATLKSLLEHPVRLVLP